MLLKKIITTLLFLCFTNLLAAAELKGDGVPDNAYLDGGVSDIAVILCHGRGQHPTWDVVDPLRKGIHEQLGYHTVSLQMPAPGGNWRTYEEHFPDAYARIAATVKVLQQKGIKRIFLMGHSMGTRMATAYLANNDKHGISGYIGIGMRNAKFGGPMDSASNLEEIDIPVIDIYGDGGDGKDAKHAARREELVSDTYKQVFIPDAEHRFSGHEDEMVKAVVDWLKIKK